MDQGEAQQNEELNKNSDVVTYQPNKEKEKCEAGINKGVIINCAILAGIQIAFLLLFGFCFKYFKKNLWPNDIGIGKYEDYAIVIFGSFGFYYSFLNNHFLASLIIVFVVGVMGTQVNMLTTWFWECSFESASYLTYGLDSSTISDALLRTIPIMISLGAILGRMSILQYTLFSLIEAIFYPMTEKILNKKLGIINGGGSYMFIFGAFFGCAASIGFNLLKQNKDEGKDKVKKSKNSIAIALIGLYFFVTRLPTMTNKNGRIAIGTVFGEFGAIFGGIISSQYYNNGKLEIMDIFYSAIGGGIMNAAYSLTCGFLWAVPILSFLSGIIVIVCTYKLRPIFEKLGLFDVANVLITFAIPAIIGEIIFAIFISSMKANDDEMWGSFVLIQKLYSYLESTAAMRDKGKEAGFRILGILIVIALSAIPGFVDGLLVGFININKNENLLEDEGILLEIENNHKKIE